MKIECVCSFCGSAIWLGDLSKLGKIIRAYCPRLNKVCNAIYRRTK